MNIDERELEALISVSELCGRVKELLKQAEEKANADLYDYWVTMRDWAQMLSGDDAADIDKTLKRIQHGKNRIIKDYPGATRQGPRGCVQYRLIELIQWWTKTNNLDPHEAASYISQVFEPRALQLTAESTSLDDLPLMKKLLPAHYPWEMLEKAIRETNSKTG